MIATRSMELTERQDRFCVWLYEHWHRTGRQPAYQDISDSLGFQSKNSCTSYVVALTKKGYLDAPRRQFKAMQLVRPSPGILQQLMRKLQQYRLPESMPFQVTPQCLLPVAWPRHRVGLHLHGPWTRIELAGINEAVALGWRIYLVTPRDVESVAEYLVHYLS